MFRPHPPPALIPDLFCWTKIGVEAGQSLEAILQRKELERLTGNGTFAWGIGNSVPALRREATSATEPLPVLFSPMLARPKTKDKKPSKLVVWLGYIDNGRINPLPEHMLITSRDANWHYALFCRSALSLLDPCGLEVDFETLRNAESGVKLGFSQVTALVRKAPASPEGNTKPYHVAFMAALEPPFHAPLALCAEVHASMAQEITETARSASPAQWTAFVARVRTEAARNLSSVASGFLAGST